LVRPGARTLIQAPDIGNELGGARFAKTGRAAHHTASISDSGDQSMSVEVPEFVEAEPKMAVVNVIERQKVWTTPMAGPPVRGHCRFCGTAFKHRVVDLGMSPLCESFLRADQLNRMEPFYPLTVWVCEQCYLVQLEEYVTGEEIFTDYAYFSSFSDSWLNHARLYVEQMIQQLDLTPQHQVVEIASNDGYLLQYFVQRGVPALGIEPAANVAKVAEAKGVPTLVKFFGVETATELARQGRQADLILGNNVLAQVPDLNDFVGGLKILLRERGVVTIEFPHLLRTIDGNQFDQVYHEHFSYFSLFAAERIFAAHGLPIFDVEELSTHGGSIRIYARHREDTTRETTDRLVALRAREEQAGVATLEYYQEFESRVRETKRKLLEFLIDAKRAGKRVVGYGAPGKGNTLLNYCGIRTDFVDFTVDRSPHKHGKFLPGTHIPIFPPERLWEARPDYVLILPWNLKTEIMGQLAGIREWGGRFVVPIPEVMVYP
jgi:2-polyprenyl-3-methyl-5-hydroxy-6-metoxy-1,4-benzoquinol methylase